MQVPKLRLIGFVVAIALLLVAQWFASRMFVELGNANRWVTQTHEVLETATILMSTLKDAETGTRGYLLTGKESYLEPYVQAVEQIDPTLTKLQTLTVDSATQQSHVEALPQLIQERLAELSETITLQKRGDSAGAWSSEATGRGEMTMDAIRRTMNKVTQEEERELQKRLQLVDRKHQQTRIVMTGGSLFGTGIVMAMCFLLQRETARRNYAEAALRHERDQLELHVQERTAQLVSANQTLNATVTELQHSEERVRQSEERYRTLVEHAPDAIYEVDVTGHFLAVNDAACLLTGYSRDELLTMRLYQVIAADDVAAEPLEIDASELQSGKTVLRNRRVQRKNGELIPVESRAKMLPTGRIHAIARDVSDRTRREEQIRQSEERYRILVEQAVDAILITDSDRQVQEVNTSVCVLTGYTREELLTMSAQELFVPEDLIAFPLQIEAIRAGKAVIRERRIQRKDGSRVSVESNSKMLSDGRIQNIVRNISERRAIEQELRESRQRYAELVRTVEGIVWEVDIKTFQFTFVSEQAERLFGYPLQQWLEPDFWVNHLHADDRAAVLEFCLAQTKQGRNHDFEYRLLAADGHVVWLRDIVTVVKENNQPVKLRGIMVDITDKKRVEMALHESERKRTAELLSLAYSLSAELPLATRLSDLCRRTAELTSCDRSSVFLREGQYYRAKYTYGNPPDIAALFPHHKVGLNDPLIVKAVATRRAVMINDAQHSSLMNADTAKRARIQAIVVAPFQDEAGDPLGFITAEYNENPGAFTELTSSLVLGLAKAVEHAIVVDRSNAERRQAAEQLQQSLQQLRALAAQLQSVREEERTRIARELHDELGQDLTGIKLDLAWLEHSLESDAQPESFMVLLDKIQSMEQHVDEMIQLGRRIASGLRPAVLDHLGLVAALQWQSREFHQQSRIVCHFSTALDEVDTDAERATAVFRIFQEALTNVMRHAQATEVDVTADVDQDDFVLTVQDNGKGVSEDRLSTQETLGLLGMRERATLLGGTFTVSGEPGRGTTVTVHMPLKSSEGGRDA